jgi:hypothetical protein
MSTENDEKAAQDGGFPVLGKRGRPRTGNEKRHNVTFLRRGNARSYIIARLRRDGHVALAEQVLAHKMSARRAAALAWGTKVSRKKTSGWPPPAPVDVSSLIG